ncbi:MAG TPA: hypothetical protein VG815_02310 [Chloroflexota bacterium]|nr:hypothetical protein [Chloroflexota bacterium]
MIGPIRAIILWLYDFLAEDTVLLIGMVVAIVATVVVAHFTKTGAGFILWGVVLAAIVVSLARTAGVRS